jgi:hypothetical protein
MKRLILSELSRLVFGFLGTYIFLFLAFFLYDVSVFLLLVPAGCVFLSNHQLKRSSWYLSLPWSRAKIIWAVVIQSLIAFLVNLGLIVVIFSLEGKLFFGDNAYLRWVALATYLVIFFFSLHRSLVGIQIGRRVPLFDLYNKKVIFKLFCSGIFLAVVWHYEIYFEPTFLLLSFLFLVFSLLSGLYSEFVLPVSTARAVNKFTAYACVVLFSVLVGGAIVVANEDGVRPHLTIKAISFLGRFPSLISEQRAFKLFIKTTVGPNPSISQHLNFIQANFNSETWQSRTLACKYSDCLNLSADVAETANITSGEVEERFLTLVGSCDFQLSENGRNNCVKKLRMDQEHMKRWLSLLEKKAVLKNWLISGDAKKQIIALKGMSFAIDASEEKAIRELGDSKDARLKAAATMFLENSKSYLAQGLNCNLKKDKNHSVCKFKENDYSM